MTRTSKISSAHARRGSVGALAVLCRAAAASALAVGLALPIAAQERSVGYPSASTVSSRGQSIANTGYRGTPTRSSSSFGGRGRGYGSYGQFARPYHSDSRRHAWYRPRYRSFRHTDYRPYRSAFRPYGYRPYYWGRSYSLYSSFRSYGVRGFPYPYPYAYPFPYLAAAAYVAPAAVYRAPDRISPSMGAVDLNVRPKAAEVHVGGRFFGLVDDFDGFPRYLWLSEGVHEIVLFHEGYDTLVERVEVDRDRVVNLRTRMVPGVATLPDELATELPAPREAPGLPPSSPPVSTEPQRVPGDLRIAPAHLRVTVSPMDAVVYLDGRLLGSGDELARLHAPLIVDPGSHVMQVVRPGFRTRELRFEAVSGEEVELEALLDAETARDV